MRKFFTLIILCGLVRSAGFITGFACENDRYRLEVISRENAFKGMIAPGQSVNIKDACGDQYFLVNFTSDEPMNKKRIYFKNC